MGREITTSLYLQVTYQDLSRSSQTMLRALEQAQQLLLTQADQQPAVNGGGSLLQPQAVVAKKDVCGPPTAAPQQPASAATASSSGEQGEAAGQPAAALEPSQPPLEPSQPACSIASHPLPDCVPRPSGARALFQPQPDLLVACLENAQTEAGRQNNGGHSDHVKSSEIADVIVDGTEKQTGNSMDSVHHLSGNNAVRGYRSTPTNPSTAATLILADASSSLEDDPVVLSGRAFGDKSGAWAQCGGGLARLLPHHHHHQPKGPGEVEEKDKGDNSLYSLLGDVGAILAVAGVLFCAVQIRKALR